MRPLSAFVVLMAVSPLSAQGFKDRSQPQPESGKAASAAQAAAPVVKSCKAYADYVSRENTALTCDELHAQAYETRANPPPTSAAKEGKKPELRVYLALYTEYCQGRHLIDAQEYKQVVKKLKTSGIVGPTTLADKLLTKAEHYPLSQAYFVGHDYMSEKLAPGFARLSDMAAALPARDPENLSKARKAYGDYAAALIEEREKYWRAIDDKMLAFCLDGSEEFRGGLCEKEEGVTACQARMAKLSTQEALDKVGAAAQKLAGLEQTQQPPK